MPARFPALRRSPRQRPHRQIRCTRLRFRLAAHSGSLRTMQSAWPTHGRHAARAWAILRPRHGLMSRRILACSQRHGVAPLRLVRSSWACMPCCPMRCGWGAWRGPAYPPCSCVSNQTTAPPWRARWQQPCRRCKARRRCCSSTTIGARPLRLGPMASTSGRKTSTPCNPASCKPCRPRACGWG